MFRCYSWLLTWSTGPRPALSTHSVNPTSISSLLAVILAGLLFCSFFATLSFSGVPWCYPHCHSGLANLPSVGANPSIVVGLPDYQARRLQLVLNTAARLIYHMRSADHVTDALVSLHWLCVPERTKSYRGLRHGTWEAGTSHSGRRSARSTNTALCQL